MFPPRLSGTRWSTWYSIFSSLIASDSFYMPRRSFMKDQLSLDLIIVFIMLDHQSKTVPYFQARRFAIASCGLVPFQMSQFFFAYLFLIGIDAFFPFSVFCLF